MKAYKGIVKGNTIVLKEKPNLPDNSEAIVILKPLVKQKQNEIVKRQLKFLDQGFDMGKILIRTRKEIHER